MDFKAKMDRFIVIVAVESVIWLVLRSFIHEFESRSVVRLIIGATGFVGGLYCLTVSTIASERIYLQHTDTVPIKVQIEKVALLAYARVIIMFLANVILIASADLLFLKGGSVGMNGGAFLLLLFLPTIVYAAHRVRVAIAEVREIKNGSDDLK